MKEEEQKEQGAKARGGGSTGGLSTQSAEPEIKYDKGMEENRVRENPGPDYQRPMHPLKEVGPFLGQWDTLKPFKLGRNNVWISVLQI